MSQGRAAMDTVQLAAQIEQYLKEPKFFADVLRQFSAQPYREVLWAWATIREKDILKRDDEGHYFI
jgi:hypothetical protein